MSDWRSATGCDFQNSRTRFCRHFLRSCLCDATSELFVEIVFFLVFLFTKCLCLLQLGVINMKCELVAADMLTKQLRILKSANVDGVMVDCWWGIVEAYAPQEYNWHGYRRLFQIVRDLKLKLQVSSVSSLSDGHL